MASVSLDSTLSRGSGVTTGHSGVEAWRLAVVAALVAQAMLWAAASALHADLSVARVFPPTPHAPPIGALLSKIELTGWVAFTVRSLLLALATGLVVRLARLEHTAHAAAQAGWLLALSPLGVVLCTDLAVGAAFVAGAGAMLLARTGRVGPAGLAAAVASLTSPFVWVCWFGVIAEVARTRAWRSSPIGAVIALAAAPVAVILWAASVGSLDSTAAQTLSAALVGRQGWGDVWTEGARTRAVVTLASAVATLVGVALIGRRRRVRASYLFVAVLAVGAGVLAGTPLGLVHAVALAFPMSIVVGVELSQRPAMEPALVAACALASLCLYLTI
ncbi:MAG: hypothetical protein H6698_01125 [Myxococcales bacterium]|nr:hypothetical protein [Myxococcales bacterium]MCB9520326.1 hypothetical protein [Myxococcales bacterium]MCB9530993.1 hypothetical protein [Myxococcales bacterium]MCB9532913.1 hypothetical protein [Myxococcales bacterium]